MPPQDEIIPIRDALSKRRDESVEVSEAHQACPSHSLALICEGHPDLSGQHDVWSDFLRTPQETRSCSNDTSYDCLACCVLGTINIANKGGPVLIASTNGSHVHAYMQPCMRACIHRFLQY